MNVSSWSIRNPVPAVLAFAMLTFFGVTAFKAMKIQMFPRRRPADGHGGGDIAGRLARPDGSRGGAQDRERPRQPAGAEAHVHPDQGCTAIISAEFRLERDSRLALEDVRSAVARIRSELPREMLDPVHQQGGIERRADRDLRDHLAEDETRKNCPGSWTTTSPGCCSA